MHINGNTTRDERVNRGTQPCRASEIGDTDATGLSEPWSGGSTPSEPPGHGEAVSRVQARPRHAIMPPPPRIPRELSMPWRRRIASSWAAFSCVLSVSYLGEKLPEPAMIAGAVVCVAGLVLTLGVVGSRR